MLLRAPILTPSALLMRRRRGLPPLVNTALDWYFSPLGLTGTPWADLTRTGLGTRVDPAGLGGVLGPHNLLANPANFAAATWLRLNATVAGSVLTSTSGGTTAIYGTGVNVLTVTASTTHSLHARIRRGTSTNPVLRVLNSASAVELVRLALGWSGDVPIITAQSGNIVGSPTVSAVAADGYYRLSVQFTTGAETTARPWLYISDTNAAGVTVDCALLQINQGTSSELVAHDAATARYLPRIAHDPLLDVNGQPYTLTEQYGAELVTNGDFASSNISAWQIVTGANSWSAGVFNATGATWVEVPTVAGRAYRLSADLAPQGTYSAELTVWQGGGFATQLMADTHTTAARTRVGFFTATSSTSRIYLRALAGAGSVNLDNISVREFLGVTPSSPPRVLGLMVEGQATNLVSTNFANWTELAATRNLNAAVAPDGSATAMHLVETAITQVHRANYSFTPSATGAHVSWCFVKAGARSRVYLQNDFGSANSTAEFNLATGTVGAITGIGGTAGIRPWSNGWFLIWFSTTTTTTNAGQVRLYLGDSTSNQSYAGDGSSGAFFWGPNTTQGTVPTSHIPNPGTGSALRVADWTGPGLALTGSALAAAFPAGFGQNTIVLRFRKGYSLPTEALLALSAGASFGTGNGLLIRANSLNVDAGGNGSAATVAAALVLDGVAVNRIAVSWSGTTMQLSVNGSASVSLGTFDFTGSGTTHLILGALTTGGLQGIGQVIYESIRVLPGQYITGAALQALTA